jgi:hypothetical protein
VATGSSGLTRAGLTESIGLVATLGGKAVLLSPLEMAHAGNLHHGGVLVGAGRHCHRKLMGAWSRPSSRHSDVVHNPLEGTKLR